MLSVNITAIVHEGGWTADKGRTGIDKRSVTTPVKLVDDVVEGDLVADTRSHGGFDKAVYSYAREDAEWWESELGVSIANGRFGENLTTQGVDVSGAVVGEHWHIGDVILEVAQPRTPCRVFAGFWDRPNLIKEFTDAQRPGAYLRVIQEGYVRAGDEIIIAERPLHGITVADLFTARGEERFRIFEILAALESSDSVRQWAENIIKRALDKEAQR